MRRPLYSVCVIVSGIMIAWILAVLIVMDVAETYFGTEPESELMSVLKVFGVSGGALFLCACGILWIGAFRFLLGRWHEMGDCAKLLWIYCMLFAPVFTPFVCYFISRRAARSA